jgi:hypothetical protein
VHDPKDKRFWLIAGEAKERVFVESVLPKLGFSGSINPANRMTATRQIYWSRAGRPT